MNGVSLLASKLKSHSRQPSSSSVWTSHESIKLGESIAVETTQLLSIDQVREQLASLIRQTNQQEEALLKYHTEMARIKEENDKLKICVIEKNFIRYKYLVFTAWRGLRGNNAILRTPEHREIIPMIQDSVNLNDTLRNLALSLVSPFNEKHALALNTSSCNQMNISTSTVKSAIGIPFQTVRRQKQHFPIP